MFPTIAAAVGEDDLRTEMEKEFNVYIDGENNLDYWRGEANESARNHFFYYYESQLTAIRVGPWKMHFASKPGGRYYEDLVTHTMPKLFNLRKDPMEHYDGVTGFHQIMKKSWVFQPAIALLTKHIKSFEKFPPRQEAASLNINEAIKKAKSASHNR